MTGSHFLLSGAVAQAMARARGWRGKFEVLMDLADTAPEDADAAALVHVVIEQAAGEILTLRSARAEVLGPELDLGGQMAALFTSGPVSSETAMQARQIDLQHRQKWRCWPPFQGVPGAPRKSLNVLARASPSCVSHSHITSTSHPAAASCASAALSRSMLRSSLGSQ